MVVGDKSMQGAVAREGRNQEPPTEERHQGMRLPLESLREGDPPNLNVMLSLSQQRFDAWVNVLKI